MDSYSSKLDEYTEVTVGDINNIVVCVKCGKDLGKVETNDWVSSGWACWIEIKKCHDCKLLFVDEKFHEMEW